MQFLSNFPKIWSSGDLQRKKQYHSIVHSQPFKIYKISQMFTNSPVYNNIDLILWFILIICKIYTKYKTDVLDSFWYIHVDTCTLYHDHEHKYFQFLHIQSLHYFKDTWPSAHSILKVLLPSLLLLSVLHSYIYIYTFNLF